MTNSQRVSELKRLQTIVQNNGLRRDIRERRNLLGSIVPLLNFDEVYHVNAQQFADILARQGFSSGMYESCEARLDVIMGQAITEPEHNLTPPPPPPQTSPGLVPTSTLTNKHDFWWFLQHATIKTRGWMVFYALIILGAVITSAYFAGRNHFMNQLVDLLRQSLKP